MTNDEGVSLSEDEIDKRLSEIEAALDQIRSSEDLIGVVELLVDGAEDKIFEEHSVASYLDGLATVLFGLDDDARNSPDWRLFGRVLKSAFYR